MAKRITEKDLLRKAVGRGPWSKVSILKSSKSGSIKYQIIARRKGCVILVEAFRNGQAYKISKTCLFAIP